jgi:hypothetical protein
MATYPQFCSLAGTAGPSGVSRSRLDALGQGHLLSWGPARRGVSPGKPCGEHSRVFPLGRGRLPPDRSHAHRLSGAQGARAAVSPRRFGCGSQPSSRSDSSKQTPSVARTCGAARRARAAVRDQQAAPTNVRLGVSPTPGGGPRRGEHRTATAATPREMYEGPTPRYECCTARQALLPAHGKASGDAARSQAVERKFVALYASIRARGLRTGGPDGLAARSSARRSYCCQ